MLIEQIEIKKKHGIGWIVLLAYLIVPSLPAMILAFRRFSPLRLRNVPQLLLFGKIPLGNSILWSLFPIVIGTGLCCAYFAGEGEESLDTWMFLLICLPLLLCGAALAIYWAYYRAYRAYLDQLLERIAKDSDLFLVDHREKVQGVGFGDKRLREALQDLAQCGIVTFVEHDKRHYSVWIIAAELVDYLETVRKAYEKSLPRHTWTCASCGASNTTIAGGSCAYCGAGEKRA